MARDGTHAASLPSPRRAKIYNRTRLVVSIASTSVSLLYLVFLVISGASHTLAQWAAAITPNPYGSVLLFSFAAGAGQFILTMPFGYFSGYVVEHRFQLSNQTLVRWMAEHLKAMAVSLPLAAGGVLVVYACLLHFGELWWLPTGVILTMVAVVFARLAPVILFPIFYSFTPLGDGPLKERIAGMCSAAGVIFTGIFTFNLSKNTKKANAGFTGIGRAKRIILGDTLVSEFTVEEIETVFAHELGHYVRHHILAGMITGTVATFLGLFVTSKLYIWSLQAAGLGAPVDLTALPLLAIWLSLFGLATSPVGNILSRRHERQADRYAVQTTRNPEAYISALRKLAAMNLADPDPHPLIEFLFYSHPSIQRRVRAAASGGIA